MTDWPFGLTLELWDNIDNTQNKFKLISSIVSVDWGPRKRGDGKRVGGTIQGGMSAAPNGIKQYHGMKFNIEITDKNHKKRFNGLYQDQKERYTQAISTGCTHMQAMVYALVCNKIEFQIKLKDIKEKWMDYKKVEKDIKNHIKEKTGYEYDVMIIHVDDNVRLLIDTDDKIKDIYKESDIQFFTRLINAASSYQWTRQVGESNWILVLNDKKTLDKNIN